MSKRKPLLGLFMFSLHAASGSLIIALLAALILGVVSQIYPIDFAIHMFPFVAVGAAPYIMLMKSEGTPKWEPYLITMPIKRKDLAAIYYINIFLTMLLAIPILGVAWVFGLVFNDTLIYFILNGGYASMAFAAGFMLLGSAIIYPLGCTKFGQRNTTGLSLVSMGASAAVVGAIAGGGGALGLPSTTISLIIVGVSFVAFAISFFMSRVIYTKVDF